MSAFPLTAVPTTAELEFDRQVDALAQTGLPERLDLADSCFRAFLEPLRDELPAGSPAGDRIPFVVVVPDLPVIDVLGTVHMVGGTGFTSMEPDDLARFRPLPELDVPGTPYLLLDVDLGAHTLDLPPSEALPRITAARRSPLTIAEGISLLVSDPGVLRSRNCFSLLGSRAEDKRVPALWVSGRRPRLGWCDQAAPHTWLGSASCAGRVAEPSRSLRPPSDDPQAGHLSSIG
jgi:hypothetical protein